MIKKKFVGHHNYTGADAYPTYVRRFFIDKSKHEKRDLQIHQLSPKIKRDAHQRQIYPRYLHMKASIATKPGT